MYVPIIYLKNARRTILWFVFCDPGRAVNVISLTTVTVTEEGGASNYFPLSETLNLQEIDVNNLQCEIASNC